MSNVVHTTRFWNNLHQVKSKPKYLNAKTINNLWEQENQ